MSPKIMAALIASLVVVGIASGSPSVSDPPRIVLWHLIGSAGLRMSRPVVERVYGRPYYPGPEEPQYKVRGGVLFIGYGKPCNSTGCHGKVADVSTNAVRYRSRTGLGVGSRIPFPPCAGSNGRCVRLWHGFRLGRDPGTGVPVWWRWATYAGRPVTAYLDVTGAGDAPYRVVSGRVGVVFQLGFTDGRVPASTYQP
jgi:hypothetical protein